MYKFSDVPLLRSGEKMLSQQKTLFVNISTSRRLQVSIPLFTEVISKGASKNGSCLS